jgi:uncharacterized protein (DUF305 family)
MNNTDKLSDLDYINHMIPHHQIAIDMSEQLIPYTKSYIMLTLTRDIIRKQNYEIWEMANMTGYTKEYIFTIKPVTKKMKMSVTQYLQHMIPHHQVAIDMSKRLLLYTKTPYLTVLAYEIIIDQQKEILTMTGLLNKNTIFLKVNYYKIKFMLLFYNIIFNIIYFHPSQPSHPFGC